MNAHHTQHFSRAVAVAALAAALVMPGAALAETVLEYEPTHNPVADNITRLEVNKLERGSRDWVEGAHMAIIDRETGQVVCEWVTSSDTQEVARELDVEKEYILRELEAPEGYTVAQDTVFVLHSVDFNTKGEVISGDDAEFSEVSGAGPEQAFVINLFDEATITQEREVHETRTVTKEVPGTTTQTSPQTGDPVRQELMLALATAGLCVVALGLHVRRNA